MNAATMLVAVRRRIYVVSALLLLFIAAALAAALAQRPTYEATSSNFVSNASVSSATDLNQGGIYLQQVVKSYATVATSSFVLGRVKSSLRLDASPDQLAKQVSAVVPADTVIIEVTATDQSPRRAAAIANAVSAQLAVAVQNLTPASSARPAVRVTRIEPASIPLQPSKPNVLLYLAGGLALGLGASALVVAVAERTDNKVRNADQVTDLLNAPPLGLIHLDSKLQADHGFAAALQTPKFAEDYKILRTNLAFLSVDEGFKSIVVTSSLPSEGKSTTAAALAHSFAEAGLRALLIDADLRRPAVGKMLGLVDAVGLVDLLIAGDSPSNYIQRWGDAGLSVLTAGRVPPNPSELLGSVRMRELLAKFEDEYDFVVLDAPPVLPVADSTILAAFTGGALVAARAGVVRQDDVRTTGSRLRAGGGRLLGGVLTMAPAQRGQRGYGYYEYRDGTASTS